MNETYIKNVIEAALLAAGRALTIAEIGQLFDDLNRPGTAEIRTALEALAADYIERGIEVKETANGFRIQVKRDLANEISRLWPERPPKYSRALLETLALIAYRQPITRAEIEAVRGVAVNPNIIKTMLERNWVKVVGLRDVPGRPELGTTKDFLDYFGLRSLDELPPLSELKAMGDVNLQLDLAKEPVDAVAADVTAAGVAAVAAGSDASGADADRAIEAASPASSEDANDADVAARDSDATTTEGVAADGDATSNDSHSAAADGVAASGAPSGGGRKAPSRRSRRRVAVSASDEAITDDTNDAVAAEGSSQDVMARAEAPDADGATETTATGEGADSEVKRADAAHDEDAGPKVRAAQAFVAEMESEDANASEDDDDEISDGDRQGSSELVASPPFNYED